MAVDQPVHRSRRPDHAFQNSIDLRQRPAGEDGHASVEAFTEAPENFCASGFRADVAGLIGEFSQRAVDVEEERNLRSSRRRGRR